MTSNFRSACIRALKGADSVAPFTFVIDVPPVPASRARVTRWGVYYGKRYKDWMAQAATHLEHYPTLGTEGPYLVLVNVVVEKAKTSKLSIPRGDVDNYVKAALDAVTKAHVAWADDVQVIFALGVKRFAAKGETPRTEIEAYPL